VHGLVLFCLALLHRCGKKWQNISNAAFVLSLGDVQNVAVDRTPAAMCMLCSLSTQPPGPPHRGTELWIPSVGAARFRDELRTAVNWQSEPSGCLSARVIYRFSRYVQSKAHSSSRHRTRCTATELSRLHTLPSLSDQTEASN